MKNSDFRIGNLIIADNDVGIVTGIPDHLECIEVSEVGYVIEECEPIQLTHDWIIKLGFENHNVKSYSIKIGTLTELGIDNLTEGLFEIYFIGLGIIKIAELEYVHQLQNLYFALKNKDLTVIL